MMGQEKTEKIQQFTSHLEQKYIKLQTKFPSCYDRKQLKDWLFFGMYECITCNSMHMPL